VRNSVLGGRLRRCYDLGRRFVLLHHAIDLLVAASEAADIQREIAEIL
jgi:hypothetical protein